MKVAISGSAGRMGQMLIAAVRADDRLTLVAEGSRDAHELVAQSDAVVDFTSPEHSLEIAREAAKKGSIHIIGTTGFTPAQEQELQTAAKNARIVKSGNFSLGVNLLESLIEEAARKLSDHYDIEIFEMHHRHKKDAPSGTALMLADAAARGRSNAAITPRLPADNNPRKPGEIGMSYARGGDVVGIHTVSFAGPGELIELKHQGFSREIYAKGALHAALWAASQKPGLYSMRDVIR